MKWLKIPVDDDVYFILCTFADRAGSSPEELVSRLITGTLKGYLRLLQEKGPEWVEKMAGSDEAKAAFKEAMASEFPEQSKLWTP